MKKSNVNKNQMNLFVWVNKQEAERSRGPKEGAKESRKEKQQQKEDEASNPIVVSKVLLDFPIIELKLSKRTELLLEKLHIKTVGELLKKTEGELLKCKNFGRKSITELNNTLSIHGLSLEKDKK